jgi:DNA/RNA-binding domain of Phe-tRNA-synthetase-like protein
MGEGAARLEVPVEQGRVSGALKREFPGLRLRYAVVEARPGRTPRGVRERLGYVASRLHGRRALNLRREPIASAYRVFFRHIGLDPDEVHTPIEAIVLERLRVGGFRSHGVVDDALTLAIVETGVAMRALDADRTTGRLNLRLSQPGERLGGEDRGMELPPDSLVLADDNHAQGLIFGDTAPGAEVDRGTRRIAIVATQVDGVPDISVEEAIWICADALAGAEAV